MASLVVFLCRSRETDPFKEIGVFANTLYRTGIGDLVPGSDEFRCR